MPKPSLSPPTVKKRSEEARRDFGGSEEGWERGGWEGRVGPPTDRTTRTVGQGEATEDGRDEAGSGGKHGAVGGARQLRIECG